MTVAELIEKLKTFPPETHVLSFHEDAPDRLHNMQKLEKAEYMKVGGYAWVVLQSKVMTYDWIGAPNVR